MKLDVCIVFFSEASRNKMSLWMFTILLWQTVWIWLDLGVSWKTFCRASCFSLETGISEIMIVLVGWNVVLNSDIFPMKFNILLHRRTRYQQNKAILPRVRTGSTSLPTWLFPEGFQNRQPPKVLILNINHLHLRLVKKQQIQGGALFIIAWSTWNQYLP